ncbi:ABC transporter permease [Methanococcoides methylutens]|uniref:Cell division protein FtsX n=1 Tax=Methanococcoides methylutens MM1 TaxID=1434104 RepID=A0A0E3SNY0_METMT|nr:ABC transporter permease [Methanococcoides methylutens]AKB84251.1 Cell division protein FtsX [Methanococcoides methylutens MM1]
MISIDDIRNNIYLQLARRNLSRQTFRTVLAAIGIIIGVIAISSMGILGNSLKMSVTDSFGDIGDKLLIYPAPGEDGVTDKQISQMKKVDGIDAIIPVYSTGDRVEYKNSYTFGSIYSIEQEDLGKLVEVDDGQFFKSGSTDCVIGASIADNLELKLGSKIEIGESRLRVVGILKERGMGFDIDADTGIFTSAQMYEKMYPDEGEEYDFVVVRAEELEKVNDIQEDIEKQLNRKEEVITVFATNIILESINEAFKSISLFLMGIGSISLLVAGVSILNVMLMSTMERTREIGVMKAVGASRKDVLTMFLLEALLLGVAASLIGGLFTIGAGYLILALVVKNTSYLLSLSTMFYIFEGILFGVATSLIGGMYPAWKASNMRPLDALRYE